MLNRRNWNETISDVQSRPRSSSKKQSKLRLKVSQFHFGTDFTQDCQITPFCMHIDTFYCYFIFKRPRKKQNKMSERLFYRFKERVIIGISSTSEYIFEQVENEIENCVRPAEKYEIFRKCISNLKMVRILRRFNYFYDSTSNKI